MLRSFYVAMDADGAALTAVEYACWLAQPCGGVVRTGFVLESPPDPVLAASLSAGALEYIAPPLEPIGESYDTLMREQHDQADRVSGEALAVCSRCGVPCETAVLTGQPEGELLARSRAVDAVVVGRHALSLCDQYLGPLTPDVLRELPQPVLVTPEKFEKPGLVMAFYDGHQRSVHALALAVEVARAQGLPLRVLVAAGPEEASPPACTAWAAQYLGDHGYEIQPEVLDLEGHGREQVLAEAAGLHPRALVVMGAFGRSRVREWLAGGSCTAHLLKHTPNPVLLCPY